MTLATLPPMYFFAHLYYTDIPSITMILFMLLFSFRKQHFRATVFGAASVLMRQTNIVWVAGALGGHLVDKMMLKIYPKTKRETATFGNFLFALKSHLKQPRILLEFIASSIGDFYGYFIIIIGFAVFLYKNGSIVGKITVKLKLYILNLNLLLSLVGDKTAHEASLHVPQLFYFSLFVLVFGSSLWIPQLLRIHRVLGSWKCMLAILWLAGVMIVIVNYNTIVHPYLVADNRHYTFYVWNRFYNRHEYARFAIIPAYIFGLVTILNSLDGSIGFKIFFVVSTVLTLCLQKLIEVRYFLIPFLLLRLNRASVKKKWTFIELLVNIIINFLTFKIFFTTEIRWSDFEDIQRIIW